MAPSEAPTRAPQSALGGELPAWLWLWVPPLMLVPIFASRLHGREFYVRWMESEQGLVENATALILVPAVVAGAMALRHRRLLPARWLAGWIALVALGCFYFAGEEVSWGQHWFGWATPEPIGALNDQGETNLHNTSSWLDQKPRTLLELWVLIGGVIVCLARRTATGARGAAGRPGGDPPHEWRTWFWPSWAVFPSALLAILIRIPERIRGSFDLAFTGVFDVRYSEAQEYFFAWFLLLYLLSIHVRLRALAASGTAAAGDAPVIVGETDVTVPSRRRRAGGR